MSETKKYIETYINTEILFNKYILAASLCEENDTYCVYENGESISIGIGSYVDIIITSTEILIKSESAVETVHIHDFNTDVDRALKKIKIEGWRAYGFAYYGLSRYTYGFDMGKEKEELIRLFIPETEYRILNNKIQIRTLHRQELEVLKRKLKYALCAKYEHQNVELLNQEKILEYDGNYYKEIVANGVKEIKNNKYQKVILSRKIPLQKRLDMKRTYIKGRELNSPARSYLCKIDGLEVAGFSPETVAEVAADGTVFTFPLAGTRALTSNPAENMRLKKELLHDTKEIAEHAISVKLAEEELAQICEKASVMVTEFMSVLERGTVQHLGSRLKGRLLEGKNPWHALSKLFPAVTASGIPKREAIEAIGRIEKDSRGLYSGSVLTYDSDGTLDAALVLRSIYQTLDETWVRVGAGIVDMSNPERELEETREKVSSVAKQLVAEHIEEETGDIILFRI